MDLLIGSNFSAVHPKNPVNLRLAYKGSKSYEDEHLKVVKNQLGWAVKGVNSRLKAGISLPVQVDTVLFVKCM